MRGLRGGDLRRRDSGGAFGRSRGAAPMRHHPTTISGLTYLTNYSTGDRVKGVARVPPISWSGSLLDLSTGVEVKTSAGVAASGVSASITARDRAVSPRRSVSACLPRRAQPSATTRC